MEKTLPHIKYTISLIFPRLIVLIFLLQLFSASYCQIDPHKLDSLSEAIRSSVKDHRKWQDSFARAQESLYQSSVAKQNTIQQKAYKDADEKKGQQFMVRLIVGVLFCIGLIIGFAVRKKPKT